MKKLSSTEILRRLAAYCSRGEKCKADVRKKMDTWNVSPEEQNKILVYLQKEKFLDEERYCRAFVNDKVRFAKWGVRKINFELKKKHLPNDLIEKTLREVNPEENAKSLHILLAQKKKSLKGINEFEIRQKLIRFAAGRGFSFDEIEKALTDLSQKNLSDGF